MDNPMTVGADEVSEEQAKAEIQKMQAQMDILRQQMQRDRERAEQFKAQTSATMACVREELAKLRASR